MVVGILALIIIVGFAIICFLVKRKIVSASKVMTDHEEESLEDLQPPQNECKLCSFIYYYSFCGAFSLQSMTAMITIDKIKVTQHRSIPVLIQIRACSVRRKNLGCL